MTNNSNSNNIARCTSSKRSRGFRSGDWGSSTCTQRKKPSISFLRSVCFLFDEEAYFEIKYNLCNDLQCYPMYIDTSEGTNKPLANTLFVVSLYDIWTILFAFNICNKSWNLQKKGQINRAIASHVLNESSSRSHCVFTIYVGVSLVHGALTTIKILYNNYLII